jgi:DNA-binding GntR family transcriptional regulator
VADPAQAPVARFARVASAIHDEITRGRYPVGTELPSIEALAKRFDVSHMTIKRALMTLVEEGLVVTRRGMRAQVVSARPAEGTGDVNVQIADLRERVDALAARVDRLDRHVDKSTGDEVS